MNLKILFVLPKFEFGGTVFSTFNMIRMLQKHGGYDIYIFPIISNGPVRHVYDDLNVLHSNFLLESSFANIHENKGFNKIRIIIGKIIKKGCEIITNNYSERLYVKVAETLQSKHHFDYVVSCQEGYSTEFVSYFNDCKRVAWFRSEMSVYLKKHISKERAERLASIYEKMDNIVCVSKTTRDDFAQYFPNIEHRILAIHNIQDVQDIVNKANENIPDPFDKQYYTLVSVGRIAPQKRFTYIPKIAYELVKDGKDKFRWYIIGDGNIMGEYDRLIEAIDKYGMHNYVKLLGSRVNPYPYIRSADALVIPSSYEACPRVVAEAHILKVPVISADYSSAREFVHDGVNGFVGSINEQKSIISKMIDNTDEWKTVISNCQKYEFDTDIILDKLLNIFSK